MNERMPQPTADEIAKRELDYVDYETALEMAYATDTDGISVNGLRSVAAAARLVGRKEGLLNNIGESLDTRATELEIAAGLAYVAELRRKQDLVFGDMERRIVGGEIETSLEHKAKPVIEALMAKYPGATFELIGDTVMCTDSSGIDFGDPNKVFDPQRSWTSIMTNTEDERFIIVVGDEQFDTRKGMTYEAYIALQKAKSDAGEDLPDSEASALAIGYPTYTLMTGEELRCVDTSSVMIAPTASANNIELSYTNIVLLDSGIRNSRVRPAVKIVV